LTTSRTQRRPEQHLLRGVLVLAFGLATAEVIGRGVSTLEAIAPTEVARTLWRDRLLLWGHASATAYDATIALVLVFMLSVLLGLPVVPRILRAPARHIVVVVNSVPLVAVVPLLGLLDRDTLPVTLAALAAIPVVWPLVDQWLAAADRSIDESPLGLYVVSGFQRLQLLGWATASGPVPQSLRAGAPLCIFGATLAGFVSADSGLGVYLAVGMWQGDARKVFAGACVTLVLCVAAYGLAAVLEKGRPGDLRVTLERASARPPLRLRKRVAHAVGAAVTASALWIVVVHAAGNRFFFRLPQEAFDLSRYDAGMRESILRALTQTVLWSSVGWLIGFAAACVLVALGALAPWTRWLSFPLLFASQTIPLTVLVSVAVVVFGRGFLSAMLFALSVCFLSSFLILQGGFVRLWKKHGDLCDVFGRRRTQFAVQVLWPGAREYIFRALAVSAPRAILGVVLAEYLVLRTGLGGLMYQARGELELDLLWLLIATVAGVGIVLQSLLALPSTLRSGNRDSEGVAGGEHV